MFVGHFSQYANLLACLTIYKYSFLSSVDFCFGNTCTVEGRWCSGWCVDFQLDSRNIGGSVVQGSVGLFIVVL